MRRGGGLQVPELGGRRSNRHLRQLSSTLKAIPTSSLLAVFLLLVLSISLFSQLNNNALDINSQIDLDGLWSSASSNGWRPSSIPRSYWPSPSEETNGYLVVRCNGGLNQQRSAICNAVLAARIMNATLVLPLLDTNSFWRDKSGFAGIYDVDHFIRSLKNDIRIVRSLPEVTVNGKKKKLKAFQINPPRDAPPSWYETVALEKMKEHGAIYLTPFSHRLAEEIDNPEYQRLRCRVNYHALRFKENVMKLTSSIIDRLRSQGKFMAIHLRFEMDMLAFAGCWDIFTPEEQKILYQYRKENFREKELEHNKRRIIGKCPLTPEEVALILHAMGFGNSTHIYLAAGPIFGGERFMKPFRTLFPHLENRSTVTPAEELAAVNADGRGLIGPAVDYMVSLLSDIFMPTYDGPSNFANNLMGHRLYYGFRSTIQPDRKALAPIFMEHEQSHSQNFEAKIRNAMQQTPFGGPHKRVHPESFYTNPWPECFCQTSTNRLEHKCPENTMKTSGHRSSKGSGLDSSHASSVAGSSTENDKMENNDNEYD